ncbi:endospore germination permease [Cohnella sp. GCM10027633]|uniref:GerAB/ArcD/ProY family transporter n=1 Tax=unclassified Cohnella TaxID=2636738 RepID=UPI00363B38E2
MKASGYQLFWMVSISSIIVISYIPIRFALASSKQDAWISMLLGSLLMMAVTWLMLRICKQHERQTFVRFVQAVFGSAVGKLVVAVYFVFWFVQMALIAKDMANFHNLVMLHETPMSVIVACMLFLVAFAVHRGGLTAVSRCAEVIGPVFVCILYVQLFLNPQDMNVKRILPIYVDTGWQAILQGALGCYPFLVDPSIILMLYYFAENKKTASRAILWGTGVAMVWGILTAMVLLFVTGPELATSLVVPVYSLTKFVTILNFIQNIDAFYIPLWLLGAFVKLSVGLFILSYGLSEWTGFKNWRAIAWALGIALFVVVMYGSHDVRIENVLKSDYERHYLYPFLYALVPLLVWAIGGIRKRRSTDGLP